MLGITVAENDNSMIIMLDKKLVPKIKIARALDDLQEADLDLSHLEAASDEEQTEIAHALNTMSGEDKEYTLLRRPQ